MNKSLPERPDLEQLKKQAKALLSGAHAVDPESLQRIAAHADPDGGAPADLALHDTQRVVAREYGFASWAKLKLYVETRTVDGAESRLIEASLAGEADIARHLLLERPALGQRSIYAAAALGNGSAIRALMDADHAMAVRKGGPRDWEPLLYLCFGRCGAEDGDRAAVAELLLQRGANPNAQWIHPDWPESPQPALYGATGVNDYPHLARVLLRAGANPNDCESRYHAAEHNHVASLEVLAEFGVDFSGVDQTWGNTPLYFLLGYTHATAAVHAGLRWLLAHGADPNVVSHTRTAAETPLHAAVRNDWSPEIVELLLAHGANANATRADGRTAYALAVSTGRNELATLLRSRGAASEVGAIDEFLGACMMANEPRARELKQQRPTIMRELSAHDRRTPLAAAREGRAEALKLMADLGFDVEVTGENGERPLHWAAWYGWLEATEVLISLRVELDPCDHRFGAPPVGWCAHGSHACVTTRSNHVGVMSALIAARASVPAGTNGSPAIMALLRRHNPKPPGSMAY